MDFKTYTEKAINRFGLRGQNALAREIGIAGATLSQFSSGKAFPSDETMIKLAELAGCPKEEALIDLNLWRSKNDPKRFAIWKNISKMIGCFVLLSLIPNICFAADTITTTAHSVYYVYRRKIKPLFFNKLKLLSFS